ncbi:MAG TPA: metal ABC transporter permease [Bdellovibrionales bacterium]|nr:metal ABC transporter permease [Bdellovibrionales bacterium]
MNEYSFLLAPFAMCVLLVGIHCYLGLHVLARGVIFVDLSLAQVATLGTAVGLLFELEHSSTAGYALSLGFTLVAALLFAWGRRFEHVFSQEAIIGIVFALATAMVILVVDRTAHGAEHIKESLIGHILWVSWNDVIRTAVLYAVVGVVHYLLRGPLIASSFSPQENARGLWWDFIFYALFGFVITSSVSVAGVLLVFSFLIVPAIVSTMFVESLRARLFFGWALGVSLSALGLFLSFKWDVPAGALLVSIFAIVPIVLLVAAPLARLGRSHPRT